MGGVISLLQFCSTVKFLLKVSLKWRVSPSIDPCRNPSSRAQGSGSPSRVSMPPSTHMLTSQVDTVTVTVRHLLPAPMDTDS